MLGHQSKRIFVHGKFYRLQEIVRCNLRHLAADNDTIGIQKVNQTGQLMSEFTPGLSHQLDAKRIFQFCCFNNILYRNNISTPHLFREDRRFVIMDSLYDFTANSTSRYFRFNTSFLSTMTHHVIFIHMDMPEFSRITVFPVIYFSVYDNAESQSPSDVDINHILLRCAVFGYILSVSHRFGVVLNENRDAQTFVEQKSQRHFTRLLEIKNRGTRS